MVTVVVMIMSLNMPVFTLQWGVRRDLLCMALLVRMESDKAWIISKYWIQCQFTFITLTCLQGFETVSSASGSCLYEQRFSNIQTFSWRILLPLAVPVKPRKCHYIWFVIVTLNCVDRVTPGRHNCPYIVYAAVLGRYVHWWRCRRFLLAVPDVSSRLFYRQLLRKQTRYDRTAACCYQRSHWWGSVVVCIVLCCPEEVLLTFVYRWLGKALL